MSGPDRRPRADRAARGRDRAQAGGGGARPAAARAGRPGRGRGGRRHGAQPPERQRHGARPPRAGRPPARAARAHCRDPARRLGLGAPERRRRGSWSAPPGEWPRRRLARRCPWGAPPSRDASQGAAADSDHRRGRRGRAALADRRAPYRRGRGQRGRARRLAERQPLSTTTTPRCSRSSPTAQPGDRQREPLRARAPGGRDARACPPSSRACPARDRRPLFTRRRRRGRRLVRRDRAPRRRRRDGDGRRGGPRDRGRALCVASSATPCAPTLESTSPAKVLAKLDR